MHAPLIDRTSMEVSPVYRAGCRAPWRRRCNFHTALRKRLGIDVMAQHKAYGLKSHGRQVGTGI